MSFIWVIIHKTSLAKNYLTSSFFRSHGFWLLENIDHFDFLTNLSFFLFRLDFCFRIGVKHWSTYYGSFVLAAALKCVFVWLCVCMCMCLRERERENSMKYQLKCLICGMCFEHTLVWKRETKSLDIKSELLLVFAHAVLTSRC